MPNSVFKDLPFEQWSELASNDPEGFEALRGEVIDAFLARVPAPQRQRLRGLQWRIDMVRDQSGTPMAACLKIYNMMWDAVVGDNGMLDTLANCSRKSRRVTQVSGTVAEVVPLTRPPSPTDD